MRKILTPLIIVLLVAVTAALWLAKPASSPAPTETGTGEPAIGGAFTLTDQNGKEVRESDFRGKVMLVFFGFTNCPDICPITTQSLSSAMEMMGAQGYQVAPVFITVDPKRDTPEVLKNYFASFDARIVGLTGSDEQLAEAASAYKAYYDPHAASNHAGGHGEHGDYKVNHSGLIYLMDKNGKYVRHFPYNASPEELVAALKEQVK